MGKNLDKYFDLEYKLYQMMDSLEIKIEDFSYGYNETEDEFYSLQNLIHEIMQNYEDLAGRFDVLQKGDKNGNKI